MGKIHLDRLKKRFGWTGGTYEALMEQIIAANHQSIANAVGRITVGRIRQQAAKIRGKTPMALPSIEEVLPKRSVFIRKGAERGELLADDLRDRLAKDLRDMLREHRTKAGAPDYVHRKGELKGQIRQELVEEFRARIIKTFEGYTKVDPRYGVPRNIEAIAITETRSVINDVKNTYYERLAEKNPGIVVKKRWRHHPHLSKTEPRPGHAYVDGTEIGINELFPVPIYRKAGPMWVPTGGSVYMAHPHDGSGGPEDVINCHCDVDYMARKATKREQEINQLHEI